MLVLLTSGAYQLTSFQQANEINLPRKQYPINFVGQ